MSTEQEMFSAERDPDEALNETAAARLIGVSPRSLQAWRVNGRGPRYMKIGRVVRYRRRELIEFLDDRTVSSTSQVVVNSV